MIKNFTKMKKLQNWDSPKFEADTTQKIEDFAEQLITISKTKNEDVIWEMNWIEFVVKPHFTVNDVIRLYYDKLFNPPEQFQAKKITEIDKKQKETDKLVNSLDEINFGDLEKILDWLCDFQKLSDDVRIYFCKEKIISIFAKNGYEIINLNEEYLDKKNATNFARFLILFSLDEINKQSAPPPSIHSLTSRWKQKFGKEAQNKYQEIENLKNKL